VGDAAAGLTRAAAAVERALERDFRRRPVQATFTGIHLHDAALPDWSRDALDAAVAEMRADRRTLADAAAPEAATLLFPDGVDAALADAHLELQIAEHESAHFVRGNPALWTGEAIFSIVSLVTREFAPIERRLEAAAARLQAIPGFLARARDVLGAAPAAWRARAIRECDVAAVWLAGRLSDWVGTLPASAALVADARRGALQACAGFTEFRRLIGAAGDSTPPAGAHPESGGEEQPGAGRDLLGLILRRGHWRPTPIDVLRAEARDALEEACATLDRRSRAVGASGWTEVQARLATLHPSPDDYLDRFTRIWRAACEAASAHDLVTWPEAPIRYVPLPDHVREAAPHLYYLFYRSPAPFDRLPIHDYVVPPIAGASQADQRARLQAMNDAVIALNHVIHHGGLGHHVQNHHAYAGASRVGRVAAVDGASRIGMVSGGTMAEGWACYACDLMEEIGFLTPLQAVAQQHTRVRLAARAAADLELHAAGATLDETAAIFRDRAMLSPDASFAEAVKISMFPGAAIMYWLGLRGLHGLRQEFRDAEGASFSLRRFHDRLLSFGSIPVPLAARLVLEERRT
jgi:hypothetical protein